MQRIWRTNGLSSAIQRPFLLCCWPGIALILKPAFCVCLSAPVHQPWRCGVRASLGVAETRYITTWAAVAPGDRQRCCCRWPSAVVWAAYYVVAADRHPKRRNAYLRGRATSAEPDNESGFLYLNPEAPWRVTRRSSGDCPELAGYSADGTVSSKRPPQNHLPLRCRSMPTAGPKA